MSSPIDWGGSRCPVPKRVVFPAIDAGHRPSSSRRRAALEDDERNRGVRAATTDRIVVAPMTE
jgi:hypothetical protein